MPLSFDELWDVIKNNNPNMDTGRIVFDVDMFKKAMKLAYDQGKIAGDEEGREFMVMAEKWRKSGKPKNSDDEHELSVFEQLFGKSKKPW